MVNCRTLLLAALDIILEEVFPDAVLETTASWCDYVIINSVFEVVNVPLIYRDAIRVTNGHNRQIFVWSRLQFIWPLKCFQSVTNFVMSPLRRRIFVCFYGKMGFFGPNSVKRSRTHIVLDEICRVRRPLHTLKIWGAGVNSPRSYGAEFVFFNVAAKATYIRLLFGKMGVFRP